MRSYLPMKRVQQTTLPPEFGDDDVRYPEPLVEHFIEQFTREGDVVFDPFAGFGTTLVAAEALGRIPYGVEFDQRRARYIRTRLRHPAHLIHGDSRRLGTYSLPPFDLSITSPPYTNRDDAEDPLSAYTVAGKGYDAYLASMQSIFGEMRQLMKPEGKVVIEVANLRGPRGVTTLAWDIGRSVAQVLDFDGEIIIVWDEPYGYGYDHSYCLLFSKPHD